MRRLLIPAFLLAFTASASAQSLPLRYGQTASTLRSVFSLPIFIAEREKFFEREGLVVTVVPINGGTDRMVAALYDGVVDVTHVSTPFLVSAALNGSDAVAIAAEFANPIYTLVARPEFKTIGALKGRTIGLAAAADTIAIATRRLLEKNSLNSGDFITRELVGTPARFKCLMDGVCDAVPLGQPDDFIALSKGYVELGRTSDALPNFQYTVTAVRRSWAAQNAEAVQRYVRALAASLRFIRDPGHRADVERTLTETTDATPEIAARILSLYLNPDRGVLPKQGEFDIKGFAQVLDMMHETGAIKGETPAVSRFIDQQFLRAAGIE